MKKVCYFLMFTLICIGWMSCNEDEKDNTIYDLEVYKGIYTLPIGHTSEIAILSGNRKYVITPEDKSIVVADYKAEKKGHDSFEVTGLKIGKTVVTVMDEITGQRQSVTIAVTPYYAALMMREPQIDLTLKNQDRREEIESCIKEETLLKHTYEFYLMMGEELTFYLFTRGDQNLEDFMNFEGQGRYTLEEAGEIYHLTVELEERSYFYELGGRSLAVFTSLWKQAQEMSRSTPSVYYLTLREDVSERYKEEYPEIEQASVTVNPVFYPNVYLPGKVFAD